MIGIAHCQMTGQFIGDSDIDNGFDPYWNDVVVLCNFRTPVGSNVFYDEKSGTNFSVDGSPPSSIIVSSYGAGNYRSCYFNASPSNSISKVLPSNWCTPTTPMTIEFFYHPLDIPTNPQKRYHLFGSLGQNFGNDQYIAYSGTPGYVGKFAYRRSSSVLYSTNAFMPNQTYYIKVTFDGVKVRLYVDDILEGEVATTSFWLNPSLPVSLGYAYVSGYAYPTQSKGYFDNFRITKAVRPSGSGVVPTKSFPTK